MATGQVSWPDRSQARSKLWPDLAAPRNVASNDKGNIMQGNNNTQPMRRRTVNEMIADSTYFGGYRIEQVGVKEWRVTKPNGNHAVWVRTFDDAKESARLMASVDGWQTPAFGMGHTSDCEFG